jgi:hypothetical protein
MSIIKSMPPKRGPEEIGQGDLFSVEKQREIRGIGMGVLKDGTPFLTQRGLAVLCGVQNAHIGTISSEWFDEIQKPRISAIKKLLSDRGDAVSAPHIEARDGQKIVYAYPDNVCLAVLEYYAFEAGSNCKDEARKNFRTLAGSALHDFIYKETGYDPANNVPDVWKIFHDRVALTYDSVPVGYFGIFKEISDMIVTLGQRGLHIDSKFVPDISVGIAWSDHWKENDFDNVYGERKKYDHEYPDYFSQAKSNPQNPWCYPEEALAEFRRWFRSVYIGDGKFEKYLVGQVKRRQLPASFTALAIAAYEKK